MEKRELLTSGSKEIYPTEIQALLEAVNLNDQTAIMWSPGHQRGDAQIVQRNWTADKAAKPAAWDTPILGALIPLINL